MRDAFERKRYNFKWNCLISSFAQSIFELNYMLLSGNCSKEIFISSL